MPWLVVAALLVVAAALGWLAAFGFPREWGDVLFFKQPAYMALHTGRFTLPTAIGYRPYVDVVYAAYPPLYTYASLAVFKLFGFGVHASLGFDVAVHLLLAGLLGWILWRKTGSQAAAALFILLSTGFLLPEGRPDELAALFALLAVMATVRRRYLSHGPAAGPEPGHAAHPGDPGGHAVSQHRFRRLRPRLALPPPRGRHRGRRRDHLRPGLAAGCGRASPGGDRPVSCPQHRPLGARSHRAAGSGAAVGRLLDLCRCVRRRRRPVPAAPSSRCAAPRRR